MSTKAQWRNGVQTFYDGDTFETLLAMAPVRFVEDFLGKAIDTTNVWSSRDTAGATEALVADAANGVAELALTNANEAQLAGLDWGDSRTLVLNQGLMAEFRFRLSVLPTGAVIAAIGLAGDHNADPDAIAESIWFRADGNGQITVEHDDTSHESSKVSTGVTLTTDDWAIGRIDCSDIADVKFFINGNRVAPATTFNMSEVPGLKLQPVARVSKGAAATVGTIQLDYVKTWMRRAA